MVLVLMLAGVRASAQSKVYIRGLKAYQDGAFDAAKELMLSELKQNPENDAAWYYLSCIISRSPEDADEAEIYLKKAIELSPDNFWYKYDLALFFGSTGRVELAVAMMEELIEQYPRKSSLYYDIINSYMALGDISKALGALDKIEAKLGKNEMIGITRLELMLKQPEANADSAYLALAEYYKDCKTPRLATALGDYYVRAYQDTLAMRYYDEATSLDEDYTPAYYGKAIVNQMKRQYGSFFENISHFIKDPVFDPASKAEFVSSLFENPQFVRTFSTDIDTLLLDLHAAHPVDTTVNSLMSSYYYSTGRPYLSVELLRQNKENYPESYGQTFEYLILLYYMNAWEQLEVEATEALLRFPSDKDILQLRAISFTSRDNPRAALEDYQAILRGKPADTTTLVVTYSAIGSIYHDLGDIKNTYKNFDKALKINPDYVLVLNNYAYFLALEGKNLKKARKMSRRTIEAEPDNPTYLDTYAWILHLMGQDLEAKAIFKHAMLYGGKESAEILGHYAEVLEALGDKDLANIYRKQAESLPKK